MTGKTPTLLDVVTQAAADTRREIHTALPGRVVALNATDNTLTVEPMIKQILRNGETVDLQPLLDVPLQFPPGGGFVFTVPVGAGDEGLIVFCERCFDGWFASGNKSAPLDARLHDYSDGFFLPGISSRPRAIPGLYLDGASMQSVDGQTYIRLSPGKISIRGDIALENHTHGGVETGSGKTGKPGT